MDAQTPFMFKGGEGVNAGVGEVEWVVAKERSACMISSLRIPGKEITNKQCRLFTPFSIKPVNSFDGD